MGYWLDDPNGGPPSYVDGPDPSMGAQETGPGQHTSKKRLLWEQGRNFLVPLSLGIADAAVGAYGAASAAGVGGGTGAATGAAPMVGLGTGVGTGGAAAAAPTLGTTVGSTLLPGSLATTSAASLGAAPAATAAVAPTVAAAAGGHGMTATEYMTLMQMGAGTAQGIAASRLSKKQQEMALQLAREKMASDERQNTQNVASKESTEDPFRQQLSQAHALATLDQMGNASYAPRQIGPPPSRYAKYVPPMSGGFSWSPTPQLQGDARSLQQNVRAGNVAPSMTSPSNFGKTAAVDLTQVDRGANPASPAVSAQGPATVLGNQPPVVPPDLLPMAGPPNSRLNGYKALTERRQRIAEWERQNPGWTIDPTTGQAVRASTAAPQRA